jgi:hypothetical protein
MNFKNKTIKIVLTSVLFSVLLIQQADAAASTTAEKGQSITLVSPNGGETFDQGQKITYKWKQTRNSKKIEVNVLTASTSVSVYEAKRYDGRGTNSKIISKEATSKIPAGQYVLKICDVTDATSTVCDISEKPFTITDVQRVVQDNNNAKSQSITILKPNGGESFEIGKNLTYQWKQTRNSKELEISILNATSVQPVFSTKRYDGWGTNKKIISGDVTAKIIPGQYKLKICDVVVDGSPVCDMSDKAFNFVAGKVEDQDDDTVATTTSNSSQKITLISPNGGESFDRGDKIPFSWKQTDNSRKIGISVLNATTSASVFTVKNRYEGWGENKKVLAAKDTLNIPAGQYKLRVCDSEAKTLVCDTSDAPFTITSKVEVVSTSTAARSQTITILSPNGGESYAAGDSIYYTWKQARNSDELQISILNSKEKPVYSVKRYDGYGENTKVIGKEATAKIPTGQYKLRICDKLKKGSPVCDISDKTFTITNGVVVPTPVIPPTVKIVLPEDDSLDDTYGATSTQSKKETRTETKTNKDAKKTVDLCTNLPDIQATVPKGYTKPGATGVAAACKKVEEPKKYETKTVCQLLKTDVVNGKASVSWKDVKCDGDAYKKALPKNKRTTTKKVEVATPSASITTYTTLQDLEFGISHPDVKALQEFLNSNGYIINDVTGEPGSIGAESDYFGQKTKQALIKFQQDKGISPAKGYFGPQTRGAMGI